MHGDTDLDARKNLGGFPKFSLTGLKVKGRVEVTGTMVQIAEEIVTELLRESWSSVATDEDLVKVQRWAGEVEVEVDMT